MKKKLEVLIDGFNLGMRHGSGIKTYGVTLLDAYRQMGHKIGILTDHRHISGKNKLLDEVNFFDQQYHTPARFTDKKIFRIMRDASKLLYRPKEQELTPRITLPDPENFLSKVAGKKYDYLANVDDVFHSANRVFGTVKKYTRLNMRHKPDVFHLTTPLPIEVPGVKTVITVHDLIPLKVPFTTLDVKNNFYYLFKKSLKKADLILSVSEHTKSDIIELYDVDEDKIQVTYQSHKKKPQMVDEVFDQIFLESRELLSQKYILFVGNIEPKKNIRSLITAMAFIEKGYKLAIVGKKAWMADQQLKDIDRYLYKDQYVFLDYVNERELSILYRHALCLVFPSLYEGFGLPVLEAMQNDCPVICSRTTSLPEVAGDAALYVNPYKYTEIRDKLNALINNEATRQELIAKGRKRVAYFSPEKYLERLNKAYEKLV